MQVRLGWKSRVSVLGESGPDLRRQLHGVNALTDRVLLAIRKPQIRPCCTVANEAQIWSLDRPILNAPQRLALLIIGSMIGHDHSLADVLVPVK